MNASRNPCFRRRSILSIRSRCARRSCCLRSSSCSQRQMQGKTANPPLPYLGTTVRRRVPQTMQWINPSSSEMYSSSRSASPDITSSICLRISSVISMPIQHPPPVRCNSAEQRAAFSVHPLSPSAESSPDDFDTTSRSISFAGLRVLFRFHCLLPPSVRP